MSKSLLSCAVFLIGLFLQSVSLSATPSFDCRKASHPVEKIVCENNLIADYDNQLSKIYSNAVSKVSSEQYPYLRSEQLAWLTKRNNCINDLMGNLTVTDCIKTMYKKRFNELKLIAPWQDTLSQSYYRSGNKDFQSGMYYSAVSKYHDAYKYSTDNVERIRALGALAEISKTEGNIALAKGYAEKVLSIDPTSQYAKDIQLLNAYSTQNVGGQAATPSSNSKSARCIALTWGPDACSAAFEKYAKKNMNNEVSQIITSPACGAAVAKVLNASFTEKDAALAVVTGALDEAGKAGMESDSFFENIFGGAAYFYSFAIKASIYDECMRN